MKSKQSKQSGRFAERKKSAGGTLVGLFFGLVLGVLGAALVVWYINKTPVPFKPGSSPTSASSENGKTSSGPSAAPAPLPGKPGDPVPEKRFQFYDILPGKAEAKVESSPDKPADKPADKIADKAADKQVEKSDKSTDDKETHKDSAKEPAKDLTKEQAKEPAKEKVFLQAGSFQNLDDAENQKAKLAFMGIEAGIQQVMVQDKVWYRVRLGPYTKPEDVSRVRSDLARQGIEAAVARKD